MTEKPDEPEKEPFVDRFVWERALRRCETVTGTRLLVLLMLGTHIDGKSGTARPSQATLARDTGLKERAVRQHLAGAVTDHWLILVRRGGRHGDRPVASVYRPRIPKFSAIPSGAAMPDGETPNRQANAGRDGPNRHAHASQPAPDGFPTGTPVPPFTSVQSLITRESVDRSAQALLRGRNAGYLDEVEGHVDELLEHYQIEVVSDAISALSSKRFLVPSKLRKALNMVIELKYGAPHELGPGTTGPSSEPRPDCTTCDPEHRGLIVLEDGAAMFCPDCHPSLRAAS